MNIQNKTIVVTGGTSGIGLELVKQLYEHNTLIVISRSGNRLTRMLEQFPMIHVFPCDLANHQALESTADDIQKAHPEIDVLINNAAVQNTPCYLDDNFNFEALRPEIALNLTAICSLSYLLLPALLKSNHKAVICNINSGLALAPKTSSAVYCATKAAINAFSTSLRYQLETTNVIVNQAFLPLVDTGMTWGRGKKKLSAAQAAEAIIEGIVKQKVNNDIGKVKLLRLLLRLAPPVAYKLMRGA